MGSETDKLFRDKLKSLEQTPPTSAWTRVEKKVRKPRGFIVWLNIAAAMLILILGIWNQWQDTAPEMTIQEITDTHSIDPNPEQEISKNEIAETPTIVEQENIRQPVPVVKHQLTKRQSINQEINQPVVIAAIPESEEVVVTVNNQSDVPQEFAIENTIAQQTFQQNRNSATILYTADEVNTRFLKKPKKTKSSPPTQIAKSNTGQKISSIAVAIKNNEVGLGDLRQLKDELLAFDFTDHNYKSNHTQDK